MGLKSFLNYASMDDLKDLKEEIMKSIQSQNEANSEKIEKVINELNERFGHESSEIRALYLEIQEIVSKFRDTVKSATLKLLHSGEKAFSDKKDEIDQIAKIKIRKVKRQTIKFIKVFEQRLTEEEDKIAQKLESPIKNALNMLGEAETKIKSSKNELVLEAQKIRNEVAKLIKKIEDGTKQLLEQEIKVNNAADRLEAEKQCFEKKRERIIESVKQLDQMIAKSRGKANAELRAPEFKDKPKQSDRCPRAADIVSHDQGSRGAKKKKRLPPGLPISSGFETKRSKH